jgi:hypothetical protein
LFLSVITQRFVAKCLRAVINLLGFQQKIVTVCADQNNTLFGGEVSRAKKMPAHLHHLLREIKLKASFWHFLLLKTWWVYACQNTYPLGLTTPFT